MTSGRMQLYLYYTSTGLYKQLQYPFALDVNLKSRRHRDECVMAEVSFARNFLP